MLKVIGDGSPTGTHVFNDRGEELQGVVAVFFRHESGGSPTIDVDLQPMEFGFPGEGKVYIGGRQVSRIIYADGGEEEF